VALLTTILSELLLLTLHHLPFTRAYPPGHARLRTRWWWYVAGFYGFAYMPVRLELWPIRQSIEWRSLLAWTAVSAVAVVVGSRWGAAGWTIQPDEDDPTRDESAVTTLDIDPALHPGRA
jgi:hypothetical protein